MPGHRRLLYGHRGASLELPENTLPSFSRALEVGATAIETDAQLTCDGHVVLSHDPTGLRMAGIAKAIRDATLDEVKSWDVGWGFVDAEGRRPFAKKGYRIPTLDEALAELGDTPFNVDVKQRRPSMIEPLLALLRRRDAEARVRLASFDTRTTRAIRRLGFQGGIGLGQIDVLLLLALPSGILRRILRPGDAVQIPIRAAGINLATRARIEAWHALGLRVDCWTINDPTTAARLLDFGADGIMSDDPAAVVSAFHPSRPAPSEA